MENSGSEPVPQRGARQIWRLLVSDYRTGYAYKQESERRLRLLMLPRMVTNASLHANILVRLMIGTPRWMSYIWRRLMLSAHSMDIARDITIGPGLELPHPLTIVIGANTHIGSNVCIHHGVNAGPTRGRWYPGDPGELRIGDGVVLYPYCHIQADVGEGAAIINHSVVVRPIPAGFLAGGTPARPVNRATQARKDQRIDAATAWDLQAAPAQVEHRD